ncbi:MAG UNVERIFIED_CONTAM: helix-turn-helix domain-containing protein [Anaerolineae bacterium]|jgi:excisionase family DNA binding protein
MNHYQRESSEWVSLRVAADILGVHPATVRSWADRGELPSRRTTGGHRRFRRADLLRVADIHRDDNTAHQEVQLILQNALGKTRMQVGEGDLEKQAWYTAMSEKRVNNCVTWGAKPTSRFRLTLLIAMKSHGPMPPSSFQLLRWANVMRRVWRKINFRCPKHCAGSSHFSGFITETILAWSEITALREQADFARLMREVQDFFNAMQLSIVEYYQED